jgi:hypothetical protein
MKEFIVLSCGVILFATTMPPPARGQRLDALVGIEHQEAPTRLKLVYGKMLSQSYTEVPSYGINIMEDAKKRVEVYFEKSMGREGKHTRWKILDAIRLPPLKRDEEISTFCKTAASNPLIEDHDFSFGIATFRPNEYLTMRVRKAWRINWETMRIDELPLANMQCSKEEPDE